MALDEALLHSVANGASLPILRFYRWQPATVTLGYGQSVTTDVDLDACRQAGLDVIRRSTGGRAVLHDHEVTYAVIAPFNSELFAGSVLDCYRVISKVLQQTLIDLGLPARLVPGRPRAGQQNSPRAVCFSAPSQYELVVNGRKVVGSAQKRHGRAFLQHGSIPIELDLDLLGRILKVSAGHAGCDLLETVGWLNQWSTRPLTVDEIENRLAAQFSQQLQIEWVASDPSADEVREAGDLYREKFGHRDWNMKR